MAGRGWHSRANSLPSVSLYPTYSAQVEEGETNSYPPAITPSSSTESVNKAPVVKAKATYIIMNSLITSKSSSVPNRRAQGGGAGANTGFVLHGSAACASRRFPAGVTQT